MSALKRLRKKKDVYEKKEGSLVFIPSGSTTLDCVLGGGWPLRRISNIIGDHSTGKTGLAVEAMINFKKKFSKGHVAYQEVESAFDVEYADKLGLDMNDVDFIEDIETVDGTMKSVYKFLARVEGSNQPGLYVIDTVDAIHDQQKKELEEGYDKAKRAGLVNSMITQFAGDFKRANANLMIVSQVRQNIGVMFGPKFRRAGGKAMDFYASQCLWLSEMGEIKKTIDKVERVIGIKIRAKLRKCKVGKPRRVCEFPIIFDYGVDDVTANVEWLKSVKKLNEFIDNYAEGYSIEELIKEIKSGNKELGTTLCNEVIDYWNQIEAKFEPEYSKY
jgi:recombination protein RecA